MKIAVLIPAYNEAGTIREIVLRVLKVATEIPLDIVVVDDGSSDETSAQLEGLPVTVLRNQSNQGKAASLWRGIQWALERNVDAVISLDGDTQHLPEDIPRFIAAAEANPGSIIIGSRLHDKKSIPVSRYRANRFANFWVAWASGYPIEDSQTGFRLYPADFLRHLQLDVSKDKGFVFESEVLIQAGWQGIRTFPVPIQAIYAEGLRASHFKGVEDITKITKMISKRLFSRWMYLPGLYRSTFQPALQRSAVRGIDADALWMLPLSIIIGILTLGLSHLWIFIAVIKRAKSVPSTRASIDAIVIPGHAIKAGKVSTDYSQRLQRAILQPGLPIVILGGLPKDGVSEAQLGAEYLKSHGVRSDLIECEEKSINTLDNLRQASGWIKNHTDPVLISNRYHLKRISTLAQGMGIQIKLLAAEDEFVLPPIIGKLFVETIYLHWYWCGRYFAQLSGNKRMLKKLTE